MNTVPMYGVWFVICEPFMLNFCYFAFSSARQSCTDKEDNINLQDFLLNVYRYIYKSILANLYDFVYMYFTNITLAMGYVMSIYYVKYFKETEKTNYSAWKIKRYSLKLAAYVSVCIDKPY